MVLSQWEYSCAYSTESQEVKELFTQRNSTANFYHPCVFDRKFQDLLNICQGKSSSTTCPLLATRLS